MSAFDPVTAIANVAGKVIDRVWPGPEQEAARNQFKLQVLQLQQTGELAQITGQMDINKTEAANDSIFVSGWRPFIGWICGMACAWNWVGLPVAKMICMTLNHPLALASADLSEMMPVLIGMLGLGGLRTAEKMKKVANGHG